jgi:hypothetical protein
MPARKRTKQKHEDPVVERLDEIRQLLMLQLVVSGVQAKEIVAALPSRVVTVRLSPKSNVLHWRASATPSECAPGYCPDAAFLSDHDGPFRITSGLALTFLGDNTLNLARRTTTLMQRLYMERKTLNRLTVSRMLSVSTFERILT